MGVFVAGCVTSTVAAPDAIHGLATIPVSKAAQLHVTLSWSAPSGGAVAYELRYSAGGPLVEAGWEAATAVPGLPSPAAAGTTQSFTIVGLKPGTSYWWAIKSKDATAGWSAISNSPLGATAKYEGYGYRTVGGGEKPIHHVTTLADSGPGSLRDAVSIGNRYVVFDVGGTITLATRLDLRGAAKSFLTIDGSTAPSPGITIAQASPLDDGVRIGDIDNVILTHLRLVGSFDFDSKPTELGDAMSTNSTSASTFVSNLVWDHLTVRNAGDSAVDLWDRVQDFTMSYCFITRNLHPMTTGGYGPSARQTLHHNLWANNGERHPQLIGRHTDFEYVNNVVYQWGYDPNPTRGYAKGAYGVRIRNNSPGPGDVDANIVNNLFLPGRRPDQALVYGAGKGPDVQEENGPATCRKQGTVYPDSRMGELWVAGNVFPRENCDEYSTIAAARSTPVGARVVADPASNLKTTVLPAVGTQYRRPDEQSLIDAVRMHGGRELVGRQR
jgi:pectate lyase